MNLLKKADSSVDEKKRKVLDVEVDGDVSELFRENLIRKCRSIIDNDKLIYNSFFIESIDENTIFVITEAEMNSVSTLLPVISEIKRDDESNRDNLKKDRRSKKNHKLKKEAESKSLTGFNKNTLDKLLGYSISMSSISTDNEIHIKDTCIYFRKYQKGSKIAKAKLGIISIGWKTGKFCKVEGDVFKCDDIIDAIYYERQYLNDSNKTNIKIMFVENKNGFEEIFSFDEFYIKRADEVYKTLCLYKNIKIEKEFYYKYISNKRNLKKICALDKECVFADVDFANIFNVIKTTSDSDFNLSLAIEGENIVIKDEESFEVFTYLCRKQVMEVLPKGDICFVDKSKPLPKKKTTSN